MSKFAQKEKKNWRHYLWWTSIIITSYIDDDDCILMPMSMSNHSKLMIVQSPKNDYYTLYKTTLLLSTIIILADPKSYLVNNLTTWNQSNRKWNKCERNNVGFFGINKPQRFATQDVTTVLFRLGLTSSNDAFRYNIGFSNQSLLDCAFM